MYLSATRAAGLQRPPVGAPGRVSGTVIALGLVSFVTDASAEMVTAVLPMYLMYGIGLGYLQLGMLDGLYTGASALLRLGGGHAADRWGRPKAVAGLGYGLSALTKLGFPLVGASVPGIAALVGVDRAGKGLRTAPRDALISASSPAAGLGRAFGVHRSLDTAGALLGPLLAFGLLAAVVDGYDTVFAASFCLAAVGVLILIFFVRSSPRAVAPRRPLRAGLAACLAPGLRRVCAATALLGLATVGDMVLYLAIQQRLELSPAVLPLLPLGTALTFMLAAAPVGRLADRTSRWRVFLGGHLLLLAAYLALVGPAPGWPYAALVLLLHGGYYAATDGVLMAHAATLLPESARATGLAVLQTAHAVARAGGAVGFGLIAVAAGGIGAGAFGAVALLLVAALAGAAWLTLRARPA